MVIFSGLTRKVDNADKKLTVTGRRFILLTGLIAPFSSVARVYWLVAVTGHV